MPYTEALETWTTYTTAAEEILQCREGTVLVQLGSLSGAAAEGQILTDGQTYPITIRSGVTVNIKRRGDLPTFYNRSPA